MKIKLKKLKRAQRQVRYDVRDICDDYKVEITNRFDELRLIADEKEPDELTRSIGGILLDAAAKHQPKKKRKNQVWISHETIDKIEEEEAEAVEEPKRRRLCKMERSL